MTSPADRPVWPDLATRKAGFDRMYATQPDRFSGPPSAFSGWALRHLRSLPAGSRLLDLGSGLGRDARRFAQEGYSVLATDYSSTAIARARSRADNPPGLRFEVSDALTAVRSSPSGSLGAVYAHALYMMLSQDELDEVVDEVRRALRPGGLHLFAVRSVTDPVAGQGEEVASDTWRRAASALGGGPDPAPYRFFRESTLADVTARGFTRIEAEFQPEAHFWFVADRRP